MAGYTYDPRQYDPRQPADFRALEHLAYRGKCPLNQLPGSAYKYFAMLQDACRAYRAGMIQKDELLKEQQAYREAYIQEITKGGAGCE